MVATIATSYVGNVPDSVGSRTILYATTCQAIGVAGKVLSAVALLLIDVVPNEVAILPDSGVEVGAMLLLRLVLSTEVFVTDSIEQTRTVDTDGALETNA